MKHVKPFFLFVDPKKSASGKQGEASSHGKGFLICRYASFPLHTESKVVRFANVTDQKFGHVLSFFFSYIHCTRHVGSAPLTVSQPHIDVHCEQRISFHVSQYPAYENCHSLPLDPQSPLHSPPLSTSPDSRRWMVRDNPAWPGQAKKDAARLERYFQIGRTISQAQLGIFSASRRKIGWEVYIRENVALPCLSSQWVSSGVSFWTSCLEVELKETRSRSYNAAQ